MTPITESFIQPTRRGNWPVEPVAHSTVTRADLSHAYIQTALSRFAPDSRQIRAAWLEATTLNCLFVSPYSEHYIGPVCHLTTTDCVLFLNQQAHLLASVAVDFGLSQALLGVDATRLEIIRARGGLRVCRLGISFRHELDRGRSLLGQMTIIRSRRMGPTAFFETRFDLQNAVSGALTAAILIEG